MPEVCLSISVYPLPLADAERELGPVYCDRCGARGDDWLGSHWLCPACRRRELMRLAKEVYSMSDEAPLLQQLADLEALVERRNDALRRLFEHIGDRRECSACQSTIFFIRHRNGRVAPYNADGVSHFATCSHPEKFRRS